MKKVVTLVLLLTVAGTPVVHAARRDKETKPAKTSAPSAAAIAENRKKVETLKGDLNGSSWEVALVPQDPKLAKESKDELLFQNNKVALRQLGAKGFKPTNYTITPPSDEGGVAIWETMQTSDKEGIIFIRGEWKEKDQVMRGILSHQQEGEPSKDYNFSSQSKVTLEPAPAETAPEVAATAPVAPAEEPKAALVATEAKT